jgi:DNA-binding CsgD family transcriptional regulator
MSAHVAILDQDGVILETNSAWKQFAKSNKIKIRPDTININYLEICDAALGEPTGAAQRVSSGIKSLIEGKIDEFIIEYPCHGPGEKSWYYMRATRLTGSDPLRLVVSHENITPLKLAEAALKNREKELETQKVNLEETVTALKVLLKQREADRQEMEERFVLNIQEMVCPYINKLGEAKLRSEHKVLIDIAKAHVNDIMSPLLKNLSSKYFNFTPQEIKVASLVKDGNTTKEISQILSISANAVTFHRKNIRTKLGLNRKKINLQTHLRSLDK